MFPLEGRAPGAPHRLTSVPTRTLFQKSGSGGCPEVAVSKPRHEHLSNDIAWDRIGGIQAPTTVPGCVTLGKLLNFSESPNCGMKMRWVRLSSIKLHGDYSDGPPSLPWKTDMAGSELRVSRMWNSEGTRKEGRTRASTVTLATEKRVTWRAWVDTLLPRPPWEKAPWLWLRAAMFLPSHAVAATGGLSQKHISQDFPDGPVAKALCSQWRGL